MPLLEYVVAEFLDPWPGFVAVIHKSWIERANKDKTICCYWPPSAKASNFAKQKALPDKEKWTKARMRVFLSDDDFENAKLLSKAAEETSNPELEKKEENLVSKRKRKKPKKLESDYEEDGDDEAESNSQSVSVESSSSSRKMPKAPEFSLNSLSAPTSENIENGDTGYEPPQKMSKPYDQDTDYSEEGILEDFVVQSPSQISVPDGVPTPRRHVGSAYITPKEKQVLTGIAQVNRTPNTPSPRRLDTITTGSPQLQVRETPRRMADIPNNFQLNVLMKLDNILENQREQLALLRRIGAATNPAPGDDFEEIVISPMDTVEELEEMEQKLKDPGYRKKLVVYLSMLGGTDCGDVVRRIMRKLGTNRLWSLFSLKGFKQKKAFNNFLLCKVVIRSSQRNSPKLTFQQLEEAIGETLKHAPQRPGGAKHKGAAGKNSASHVDSELGRLFSDSEEENQSCTP